LKLVDGLYLWIASLNYAFPVFWRAFSDTAIPFPGMRGLIDPWISVPVFLAILAATLAASVPKLRSTASLFFCTGILLTVWIGLVFYVPNGGALPCGLAVTNMLILSLRSTQAQSEAL